MYTQETRICCFTGHRPEGLPFGYNETSHEALMTKAVLISLIMDLINKGCKTFITGCARGADMICGELILFLRDTNNLDIELICAVPFIGQPDGWEKKWKRRYNHLLESADTTRIICNQYTKDSFHRRNRYMVDNSTDLIAVYNGITTGGGTVYTIQYAIKEGKRVTILNLKDHTIIRKNIGE